MVHPFDNLHHGCIFGQIYQTKHDNMACRIDHHMTNAAMQPGPTDVPSGLAAVCHSYMKKQMIFKNLSWDKQFMIARR